MGRPDAGTLRSARLARALPALACAGLLFFNLGKPALWNDEAETALLGQSVLAHGVPIVHSPQGLITTQYSLSSHESDSRGLFIWNTWLPAYLSALGQAAFGRDSRGARLPFALAAFLAFLLAQRLFQRLAAKTPLAAELASWFLALNVPWLLLMRQGRYYSLSCLGALAATWFYLSLLEGRRGAALGLGASLLGLLHSSFFYAPLAAAALGLDALARRRRDPAFLTRFMWTLAAVAALSAPVAWKFRIWARPGIHGYPASEAFSFLKTFLAWLHQCALASPVLLAWLWIRRPGLRKAEPLRLPLAWAAASLALLSFTAAEPYGRYLAFLIPWACFAMGLWAADLAGSSGWRAAAIAGLCLSSNLLYAGPVKLLSWGGRGRERSVSEIMRRKLAETRLGSPLADYVGELARGEGGWVEAVGSLLRAQGGPEQAIFADSEDLSLAFYTGLKLVDPRDLGARIPDWIIPSPWLELTPDTERAVRELLRKRAYEPIHVEAPATLWQNNPDIPYHVFRPRRAPRVVYKLTGPI